MTHTAAKPEQPGDKEYVGGCHCKKFRYRFYWRPFENGEHGICNCNCSICEIKGLLYAHMDASAFELTSGKMEELTNYQFYKKVLNRYFCPVCGVEMWETQPDENMVGVNVRTVDGVDVTKLKLEPDDGRSL
ncbi:GFA domain-containing protein [Phanerochaete sordida]|uniref:GFA domain-containing protein n=1 Tax=Phanerochaete sordida TaxID=48140 RepID=A0A9P3GKH0_9APHY|nr:GFA domain-containing protein [Phanerochaete sordida]